LNIEEEKALQERRLISKHFGAILVAFVSFGALLVSVGQIYITKHLGEQQAQLIRDQEQRQSQAQQDQTVLTRALKDAEQETRSTDSSLKLAQFLIDNQVDLLSADESKRKRMETILFATFDPHVIVPVLERLKNVPFSPDSQDKLKTILNRAKEIETQNTELQARSESSERVIPPASPPIKFSGNTSKRIALVIGNGEYDEYAQLRNAVNDAQDMAKLLRELGFDVIYSENVNQKEMKRTIQAFGEKLRSSQGVGLFYYAGHAVQVQGNNYFIPIGARVQGEAELEFEGVAAGFVLAQMQDARNPMNIVILDACRNNPFGSNSRSISQGLAVMDAPTGTIVAYATAPGSVASDGNQRNGVYTQELLKYMSVPGLTIEEVFKRVRASVRNLTKGKQIPWESSSLIGEFYFMDKHRASALQESTTEDKAKAER
jgi:hypothetical protein